ncbi:MAG: hypothetical protein QXF90_08155 [Thermofilaceae archaeon]
MRAILLMLCTLLLSACLQLTLCEDRFFECVKLLEKLSEEGVDVSMQVQTLNVALEMYRANKSVEAEAIIERLLRELREAEQQLPRYRLQKWLQVGVRVVALLAIPPLFYYFFPRLYALAWAYSRRGWVLKEVVKRDTKR